MSDNGTINDDLMCDGTVPFQHSISCLTASVECDDNDKSMRFEQNRLDSFATWPENAPIEAKKVAKAGFYYSGNGFAVKCFACKRIIDEWNFGDQAIQKHAVLNSNCDFVLHLSDNVPINEQRRCRSYARPNVAEESLQTNDSARPQNLRISLRSNNSDGKTWKSFGSLISEAERLRTFNGWSFSFVKPEELARNGFFYLRETDKVMCFFCRGVLGEWEDGDDPAVEHRKHFRRCPFINGFNVGNVPLSRSPEDEGIADTWGGDVTGKYNYEADVFLRPEKTTDLKLSKLGINEHAAPKHPNYATYESRLRTYESWPIVITQKPKSLAEAGFYYAGFSDHVRCFCCDGGLRNWESDEDPWVEHAKYYGKCCFLNLIKGHEFVKRAQNNNSPILPSRPGPLTSAKTMNDDPIEVIINHNMNSEIAKTVLETGIENEIVRKVIAKKIELTGTMYDDANALTEACIDFPTTLELKSETKAPIDENLHTSTTKPSTTFDLSVQDEYRQLKEMKLCKICMDDEISIVFLPCGHLICCPKCAPSLKDCPMCRKEIHGTVRTFLS